MKNSTQKARPERRADPAEFPLDVGRACPFDGLFWRVEEFLTAFDEGRDLSRFRVAA
jgi:hypothetical protein